MTAVEDQRGSKRSLTRPTEVLLVCHRKVVSTGRARRCNRYSCLNQSSRVVTGHGRRAESERPASSVRISERFAPDLTRACSHFDERSGWPLLADLRLMNLVSGTRLHVGRRKPRRGSSFVLPVTRADSSLRLRSSESSPERNQTSGVECVSYSALNYRVLTTS